MELWLRPKTTSYSVWRVIFEGLELKAATAKADFIKKAREKGIIVKELGGRY